MDASDPSDGATEDAALDAGLDAAADASTNDARVPDAADDAGSDAGDADVPSGPPMTLAETGLYAEGSTSELAEGVIAYAPRYALWSDGAEKARFLWLPEGAQIDVSDVDAFVFPVGTKVWKEFSLDGTKLETRLLWKQEQGWQHLAYAWDEAQSEAVLTTRGAQDVLGTEHDIPPRTQCRECHNGARDTILGVSAVQLAHEGEGATLASLSEDGLLSAAVPSDWAPPDTLEWNALGYMHANCGNCHNPLGQAYDRVDLDLWLRVEQLGDAMSTESYLSTVDVAMSDANTGDSFRIASGMPDMSGVISRMRARGTDLAMPPIASERVDDAGVELLETWIDSL
jgi:hypothetical protein